VSRKNRNKPVEPTPEPEVEEAAEVEPTPEPEVEADPFVRAMPTLEEIIERGYTQEVAEGILAELKADADGELEPGQGAEQATVVVEFRGSWTKYQPGDVAGFDEHLAKKLLGMFMVDPRGNKSPLCHRYKKPVLDRLGITKGGSNPDKPAGGVDKKHVVGPDSHELVGGPAHRAKD
jgi:hypothetical protein